MCAVYSSSSPLVELVYCTMARLSKCCMVDGWCMGKPERLSSSSLVRLGNFSLQHQRERGACAPITACQPGNEQPCSLPHSNGTGRTGWRRCKTLSISAGVRSFPWRRRRLAVSLLRAWSCANALLRRDAGADCGLALLRARLTLPRNGLSNT